MITIRKAATKDITAIAELRFKQGWYHARLDVFFTLVPGAKEKHRNIIKSCLRSLRQCLIVAEARDQIVGFALGTLKPRPPFSKVKIIGFIDDVYILPAYRRQGIAGQLLNEMQIWFRKRGIRYVELTVHVQNVIGQSVWKKYGFSECVIKMRKKI